MTTSSPRDESSTRRTSSWRPIRSRRVERHGGAAKLLVEQAKESRADLIVVGSHGKNLAERLVLGSVSRKVVQDASCDVLVVR